MFDPSNSLLPEPLPVGWLKRCPKCGAWLSLQLKEAREDKQQGTIETYRCDRCDATFDFAERHPPGAV